MNKWYKIILAVSLAALGFRYAYSYTHPVVVNPLYKPVPTDMKEYFAKMQKLAAASVQQQKKEDPTKPFKDTKKRRISMQMLLLGLNDGAFVRVGLQQPRKTDVLLAMQSQLLNAVLTSENEIEALHQCPQKLDDPEHFKMFLVDAPPNAKLYCEPREACEKGVGAVKLKITAGLKTDPNAALLGDVFDVAWKATKCVGPRKKVVDLKTDKAFVIFQ